MNPAGAAPGEDQLARAAVLIDLGRYDAAADALAPLLATDPDNSDAHAYLAYARVRAGEDTAAAGSARTALRLRPDNVFAWKLLVLAELELWRADEPARTAHLDAARDAAERCVELEPWSPECHRLHALVLAPRDDVAALAAIDTALELDPDDPGLLHVVRGRVLWQEAGALSPWGLAARDSFVEALRLDPAHVEALYLLACHDMASERWESAEQRVRRAAELQPALGPVARDLLGRIPPP
ncbi:tetratricopeptide repeat protein, partial [Nocardia sp. NPDC004415]